MCWSAEVSVAMVGIGAAATAATAWRGEARGIWVTLGFFTFMEALQAAGYAVVDDCTNPANRAVTLLSYLHIAVQPFFINAFAMAIVGHTVPARTRRAVWAVCGAATAWMLAQLIPLEALGTCRPGSVLCGERLCTITGTWHIGWEVPLNALTGYIPSLMGQTLQFPSYILAAFVMPLFYGAWRFVLFHAAVGPILANLLTDNPNEMPAIWCLFSVAIILVGMSPAIRRPLAGPRGRTA
ncbi:DUF5765 domain-containing protein [Rhodovulum adriaticum]|uniref:Uncharacterized protein n=1 Tax=Rhodovulum adriaticum TaxID=35804 RepID=A0A4R2NMK3_RHOAD|nr:DUF5765 domain-containing protein [Rhodovulum adriaticum]MBK1635781.1 hypothetical protein [Rhodovulum adriaticum]TCP22518.1 hypothetical protein EV656_106104 [Rhodovulum adriaticum]